MDNPREDADVDQLRKNGAFTISAVRADDETKGMEVEFGKLHVGLKALARQRDDQEELVQECKAVIVCRDRRCDRVVRSFELRLLALVEKNRSDPRYRRYFPDGLRAVTEAEERVVEPKLVRDILKSLDEDKDKPDFESLHQDFFAKLLAAVEAVEVADKACTQAEDDLSRLEDKTMAECKVRWVEERKKLHADLSKKFPSDAARVESYFLRFARPRKKPSE